MAVRGRSPLKTLWRAAAVLAVLCVLLYISAGQWLPVVGGRLIYDEGPAKADIAVVLAGDPSGGRLRFGAELARQGYVPLVIVSGPDGLYELNEADAGIQYIVQKGYPATWFLPVRHHAHSTKEEAVPIIAELQRRNIHSFILVTSNYHTRRARGVFLESLKNLESLKRMPIGLQMRVAASPDSLFEPAVWWHNRESRKIVFMEWIKSVTSIFGI